MAIFRYFWRMSCCRSPPGSVPRARDKNKNCLYNDELEPQTHAYASVFCLHAIFTSKTTTDWHLSNLCMQSSQSLKINSGLLPKDKNSILGCRNNLETNEREQYKNTPPRDVATTSDLVGHHLQELLIAHDAKAIIAHHLLQLLLNLPGRESLLLRRNAQRWSITELRYHIVISCALPSTPNSRSRRLQQACLRQGQ